ncbi:MAG: hypothetical protein QW514_04290 [Thermoprotei archaeon]
MAAQIENLKKAISEASLKFKEMESLSGYISIIVETSPDPVAASLLLSSYLISHNKPFTVRFIDPFLSITNLTKPPHGVTLFLGYTGLQSPKSYPSLEISTYSDPPLFGNVLNPHIFGLNGVLIGSTTALTYLLLKELGYTTPNLASAIIGGILASQADFDPEKLGGLNKNVLSDLEQISSVESSNGLKIPMVEGIDLSVALSLMLDPFVLGVSGDQKGSLNMIQDLVKKKRLNKQSGLVSGIDARVLFDELSKIRLQNGFKEVDEKTLLGSIYMDRSHPIDSPLRNAIGVALALEACVSLHALTLIYGVFLRGKKEEYRQVFEIMQNYSTMIASLAKQIIQSQEYFRETQNALYVFAPPQTQRGLALRTAKIIAQNKAFHFKPVILVSSINHWSQAVGVISPQNSSTIDLGNIFKIAAERSKGVGYGSSNHAIAFIPTPYVESFFDDIDVRLSG